MRGRTWAGTWLVLAGCAEWPRFANLPDSAEYPAADVEPRVEVSWQAPLVEGAGEFPADPEDPQQLALQALSTNAALRVDGVISGAGWNSGGEDGYDCPTGQIGPLSEGFYRYDVDLFTFDIGGSVPIFVCARMVVTPREPTEETLGWDLGLLVQDSQGCYVPLSFQVYRGLQVGYGGNMGGAVGEWGENLAPGSYALVVGSYTPTGEDRVLDYNLGVSTFAEYTESADCAWTVPAQRDPHCYCPLLEVEAP